MTDWKCWIVQRAKDKRTLSLNDTASTIWLQCPLPEQFTHTLYSMYENLSSESGSCLGTATCSSLCVFVRYQTVCYSLAMIKSSRLACRYLCKHRRVGLQSNFGLIYYECKKLQNMYVCITKDILKQNITVKKYSSHSLANVSDLVF